MAKKMPPKMDIRLNNLRCGAAIVAVFLLAMASAHSGFRALRDTWRLFKAGTQDFAVAYREKLTPARALLPDHGELGYISDSNDEGEFYLTDVSANGDWAGSPICKLANKEKGEAQRILKIWLKNGVLIEDKYHSPRGAGRLTGSPSTKGEPPKSSVRCTGLRREKDPTTNTGTDFAGIAGIGHD